MEIASLESGNDDVISVSTHAITCSICIHDIEVGDEAVSPKPCEHLFHRECILEWVNCNHTECPFCRAEIITRTDVENVLSEQQPFTQSQALLEN
jgi:E3 ubiquitin-protein ligase DOA10